MKVNKRLIKIAAICLIVSMGLVFFAYKIMRQAAQPEARKKTVHFNADITKGTIITKNDLILKDTPVSLITENTVMSKEEINDKRLVVDANKGEMVYLNNVTERGNIRIDVDNMWIIGIDVKDISNFLGVQLKTGEEYALIHKNYIDNKYTGSADIINKVKIVNMVDNTGREILENGEGVAKTINVAVNTQEEMLEIADRKEKGRFEIAKPPKKWTFKEVSENQANLENVNSQ